MIIESAFLPTPWLHNPHCQTLWAGVVRPSPALPLVRERIELPDGDFVDIDWHQSDARSRHGPVVVIMHGLTGSIESNYARGQMKALHALGCRVVLMNFRGQSGEPNRLPRSYHSGDTGDIDFLVRLLKQREPDTPIAVVGYSVGGNVLLKWLGEQGDAAPVVTGVAVSPPFDLTKCAIAINQGFSRIYQKKLLKELCATVLEKFASLETPPFALPDLDALDDFFLYDDAITAPLNGFRDVTHYYNDSSSIHYLNAIRKPALVIHAVDDPFMSPDIVPSEAQLSPQVTIELSQRGGHVGFVAANRFGAPRYWLEQRIPAYLADCFGLPQP
jgi:predicted alpha/beta-fold hydrolase